MSDDRSWYTADYPELRDASPWVMQDMIEGQPGLPAAILDSPSPAVGAAAAAIRAPRPAAGRSWSPAAAPPSTARWRWRRWLPTRCPTLGWSPARRWMPRSRPGPGASAWGLPRRRHRRDAGGDGVRAGAGATIGRSPQSPLSVPAPPTTSSPLRSSIGRGATPWPTPARSGRRLAGGKPRHEQWSGRNHRVRAGPAPGSGRGCAHHLRRPPDHHHRPGYRRGLGPRAGAEDRGGRPHPGHRPPAGDAPARPPGRVRRRSYGCGADRHRPPRRGAPRPPPGRG